MPISENAAENIANKKIIESKDYTPDSNVVTQSSSDGYKPGFYEYYKEHSPHKSRTEEEKEADEKRERRNKLLASISDGLTAFHKIYTYARGGQPMNYGGSLSERMRDYYERLNKEREANEKEYFNGLMNAKRLDDELSMQKQRQDRFDRETKIKEEKAAAHNDYLQSVNAKNVEMAAYYKAKWEALEEGKDIDIALKEAKEAQARAAARLANTRANAGGFAPSANKGVGGYTTKKTIERDKNGRVIGSTTTRTSASSGSQGDDSEGEKIIVNW